MFNVATNMIDGLPELEMGGTYRFVLRSDAQRERLLHRLTECRDSAVVAHDGGLIGNLNVWENLALPVYYHAHRIPADLEARVIELFGRCGMSDELEVRSLLRKRPSALSMFERRLVGFVRAMLEEPELIVYDRIYDGFTPEEAERMARMETLFYLYYPFRTSVLLSYHEHVADQTASRHVVHL